MTSLMDVLNDPARKQAMVTDALHVLDQEVSDKSGISGLAVKGAFALVKAFKPGILSEVIESLLPDFARALEPMLARYTGGPSGVEPYLRQHQNEFVQSLLGVTDERARRTTNQTLLKAYQKLRPTGEKHVAEAVPRVAGLIQRHLGPLLQRPA